MFGSFCFLICWLGEYGRATVKIILEVGVCTPFLHNLNI